MPEAPTISVPTRTHVPLSRDAMAICVILLATVVFRITSFVPAVVDTDEGLFMVQAREFLNGGWPLVAAWDMHPIGAPVLFAIAFLLFGVSVEAARLLGMICVGATGMALFAAVRAVGAPRAIGLGAGVLYAAQSVLLSGLTTSTELLIAPFVTGAMAIGFRATMRAMGPDPAPPGFGAVVAAGLLIGCTLLIKQVSAPEGCLVFTLLVLPALVRRVLTIRQALVMALLYTLLCATPFLVAGFAYWTQGWLDQYLDGSILAPFRYSLERIAGQVALRLTLAAMTSLGFGFLSAAIAIAAWRPAEAARPVALLAAFTVLWFIVAWAAIAGPGFYFAHYFLLWLPPLSILAAIGAWRVALVFARPGTTRIAYAGLVGMIALNAWLTELETRFERGPGWMIRDPVREVGAAVARAAGPDGDAFVANYHPTVYILSGARLSTRFPFPAHLTGNFEDLSDTNTLVELDRVLASRPRVIVVDRGWMHNMRSEAASRVLAAIEQGYELFATIVEYRGPVEVWRRKDGGQGAGNSAEERPVSQ